MQCDGRLDAILKFHWCRSKTSKETCDAVDLVAENLTNIRDRKLKYHCTLSNKFSSLQSVKLWAFLGNIMTLPTFSKF